MTRKSMKFLVGSLIMASLLPLSVQAVNVFQNPLNIPSKILSPFWEFRGGYNHEGIDVDTPMGTPLYAVADGVVTKAAPDSKGVDKGGGHMIFIDHGDQMESRYMHLSTYAVELGQVVKAGDLIGYSGSSGDSTKPLLHYELRIAKTPVDPTFIFELPLSVEKEEHETLPVIEESFKAPQY